MRAQGISYPLLDGRPHHHHLAVQLLGRPHPVWNVSGQADDQIVALRQHLSRRSVRRALVSSELLSETDISGARRVIDTLGMPVHVLITWRPLAQVLPSSWQQGASTGRQVPLDDWLEDVLDGHDRLDLSPLMALRADDGFTLVERWASLVGPDNVTVVIPDPDDTASVFREVEQFLGVRTRTLREQTSNESLSYLASEIARRTGELSGGIAQRDRLELIQGALVKGLKATAADAGPRTSLPTWAVDKVRAVALALGERMVNAGVHIQGDVSAIARPQDPEAGAGQAASDVTPVPIELAADALAAVLVRATAAPYVPAGDDSAPRSADSAAAHPGPHTERGPDNGAAPSGLSWRLLYQGHLLAGGTEQWREFAARMAQEACDDDSARGSDGRGLMGAAGLRLLREVNVRTAGLLSAQDREHLITAGLGPALMAQESSAAEILVVEEATSRRLRDVDDPHVGPHGTDPDTHDHMTFLMTVNATSATIAAAVRRVPPEEGREGD